jgi:hypothetical protein
MLRKFIFNCSQKSPWRFFLIIFLHLASSIPVTSQDLGNGFFDHGVACAQSTSRGIVATTDGNGRNIVLLWLFDHRGSYGLLMIDAQTGRSQTFPVPFPAGDAVYASLLSRKNKFYTYFNNHFTEFDPASRSFTFTGKAGDRNAMGMTEDDEGIIWAVTYPKSTLVSFNPQTKEFKEYGALNKQNWNQYPRYLARDDAGWIYAGLGISASQIVAFDPGTGTIKPMLREAERKRGTASVYRNHNGKVYGRPLTEGSDDWYEFYKGKRRKIKKHHAAPLPAVTGGSGLFHAGFPDGKKIKTISLLERKLVIEDPKTNSQTEVPFDYDSEGAWVMGVAASPDGRIVGGTTFPVRFFIFDPKTNKFINHEAFGQFDAITRQGDRFFIASYGGGCLLEWNPASPWINTIGNKTYRPWNPVKDTSLYSNEATNPLFIAGTNPVINRPHRLLAYPDDKTIIMSGTPGYGYTGGGLLFWDREKKSQTLLQDSAVIPNQSTFSLVALPGGKFMGGTTTNPGTGGERKAKEAELYIMDMASQNIDWHAVILPGVQEYTDLCMGPKDGLIYGVADRKKFFAFDPVKRVLVHQQNIDTAFGTTTARESPRVFIIDPKGETYLLFQNGIGHLEPGSFKMTMIARSPVPINVSGDYFNGRIYFVSGSHLCSYQLDAAAPGSDTPKAYFKKGPATTLKWDHGPVSLGMVMSLDMAPAPGKPSQDLLISRIWDGIYSYPSQGAFSGESLLKQPYFMGSAGILLFQPVDWDKDGITDLIAADRDGFLYLLPGNKTPDGIRYNKSNKAIMRDAVNGLPFNIPYENPNNPRVDDLGGYIDAQYYNYVYPKTYTSPSFNKFKDLIIGDFAGNLWWLPDQSDGSGQPSYSGIKYAKEESRQRFGIQYQKDLGLDYVKPAEKIHDEQGRPFLLGAAKQHKAFFKGSNTRPVIYPDQSGAPGLLVIAGSNLQQIFYLKRVNPLRERKPVFRNMGEIKIAGLDESTLNFHSKICLFENKGRKDLLLTTGNHIAILRNNGWKNGVPHFTFHNWVSGPDVTGSFYAFNDMFTDSRGKRYIIHFTGTYWNMIPVEKTKDGIRLHYTNSLKIMDQNGIFRVEGETDPQLAPEWGYHRINRWNFDGSGNNHLVAATDKGLLYLLKDDPALSKAGEFIFSSSGPLKDASGNVIKIHNRAVAAGIDLNEDGREDLLVGGISYQLGIKSDPHPGGGVYYMINMGNDPKGMPVLSPPQPLDLGPDFKPRINSHIGLQVLDIDNDDEKEVIVSLQDAGWDGRIYRKIKGKTGLQYTGSKVPVIPINEQVLDLYGDGNYELVRPGGERGVGDFRKLERD